MREKIAYFPKFVAISAVVSCVFHFEKEKMLLITSARHWRQAGQSV
jgi:hypothetical protein